MFKFIFLDDERIPADVTWTKLPKSNAQVVRTPNDFKLSFIESLDSDSVLISFDHDIQSFINGDEITGYDCLKWMVDYIIDHNISINKIQCIFHTQNPVGKANMEGYWNNFVRIMNTGNL